MPRRPVDPADLGPDGEEPARGVFHSQCWILLGGSTGTRTVDLRVKRAQGSSGDSDGYEVYNPAITQAATCNAAARELLIRPPGGCFDIIDGES